MKLILSLIFLLTVSCVSNTTVVDKTINYAPSSQVSSEEVLNIAESYRVHKWTPSKANIKHGLDSNGIMVNTPDSTMDINIAARPGWWISDQTNIGIPYKWGGFDTPISFSVKITQGYHAGDVYTSSKRKKLWNGVSDQSCGVDCSGFVSRCLRLEKHHSTRELPDICQELNSFEELQPGDIINKRNVHVLLFDRFVDKEKGIFLAYETGSAPTWKVLKHAVSVKHLKVLGYKPYRYNNIIKKSH